MPATLDLLGVHNLPLFLLAGLLLNITPGPDFLFVVGSTAAGGRRAGILAALGVGLGCIMHVTLAALGISALLAASARASTILQWIGAAYLVKIGVSMLIARPKLDGALATTTVITNTRRVFWSGALTNALNPKVAFFFMAFLPQFIRNDAPHQALGFMLLGLLFTINGTLISITVAWLAGSARNRFAGNSTFGSWLQRAAGGLFLALGIRLAFSPR